MTGTSTAAFLNFDGQTTSNCTDTTMPSQPSCNFLNRYTIDGTTTNDTTTPTYNHLGHTGLDHLNLFDEPAPDGNSFAQGSFGQIFQAPSTGTLSEFDLNLACKVPAGTVTPSIQGSIYSMNSNQSAIIAKIGSADLDFSSCPTTTSFSPPPSTFGWVPFAFNVPVTAGTNYVVLLTGSAIGGAQPVAAPTAVTGFAAAATVGVPFTDAVTADGFPARPTR